MENIDLAIATSILGPIAIGIIALLIHGLRQRKQTKIDSARLSMELMRPWKNSPAFIDFLGRMHDSHIDENDEDLIRETLILLEEIAILWKEGTLTENHVKEFFGTIIKDIKNNKIMMKYFEVLREENPNYYYVNLAKLFKASKKWNI